MPLNLKGCLSVSIFMDVFGEWFPLLQKIQLCYCLWQIKHTCEGHYQVLLRYRTTSHHTTSITNYYHVTVAAAALTTTTTTTTTTITTTSTTKLTVIISYDKLMTYLGSLAGNEHLCTWGSRHISPWDPSSLLVHATLYWSTACSRPSSSSLAAASAAATSTRDQLTWTWPMSPRWQSFGNTRCADCSWIIPVNIKNLIKT